MSTRSLAGLLLVLALPAWAELGHDLRPGLGQAAPADFEAVILPDGTGLPVGKGSVGAGRMLYAQHCASCHGADGRQAGNALAGGDATLTSARPLRTVGSYWPFATTVFDYIQRAMPYGNEKSLAVDEVYAITAYVLHLNDIVGEAATLDAVSLPRVRMPNQEGFFWADEFRSHKTGEQ